MFQYGNGWMFSGSELSTLQECPRRWYYENDRRLRVKGETKVPLDAGGAIHFGLERMFQGSSNWVQEGVDHYEEAVSGVWATVEERSPTWQKLVTGRHQVYMALTHYPWKETDFPNVETLEESIVVEVPCPDPLRKEEPPRFQGMKLDRTLAFTGPAGPRRFLHDTKTTGEQRLALLAKSMRLRMQFIGYAWGYQQVKGERLEGVVLDFIRKARVNFSRKTGDLTSVTPIQDPKEYFLREPIVVPERALREYPTWFWWVTDQLMAMRRAGFGLLHRDEKGWGYYPQNTNACRSYGSMCPYFDICLMATERSRVLQMENRYEVAETIHGEEYLAGEEED